MFTGEKTSPAIRVLVVDDDEDDYLIARDLLREIDGSRYEVDWLSDPNEAIGRLSAPDISTQYDVCLLDFRLGRFNGLEVLRESIARGTTLPIILLTGQEDSDVDREAVRIGASDYLVKGRINSILLERAIRYARQQKNTVEALREQTEFVSAILNTAGALVVVLDSAGRIVRFNRQCELTTGYQFAEVEDRPFYEFLLAPDEVDEVAKFFRSLTTDQGMMQHENDWMTRVGERRRIAWSNTTLAGRDGSVAFVVATGIDVTDRRRAEAALAEAREREMEVGSRIQSTLLVRKPPINLPGVTIGATSLPSQKVGGDYFDFFVYGDNCIDVLVGDVMGKGVSAALMAAGAKTQFQRAVRRLGFAISPFSRLPEPDEIVAATHSILTKHLVGLNSFLTLAYARFDLANRTLKFVDCGHPQPLHLVAATGECHRLEGDNMPLGMSERERYKQITVPFAPGDVFFFYSDGMTEASGEGDDLFGDERVIEAVTRLVMQSDSPSGSAQGIADGAIAAVQEFCCSAGTDISDDLTCVAVRIEDWQPPRRLAYHVMEMRSNAEDMETARDFVAAFCLSHLRESVSEEERDLMALAVNEAIGNSIEHAYGGSADGRIQIEADAYADKVKFHIYDNGAPFRNLANIPPPSFDGSRDSGFGLFIMEQCFDAVEHSRDEVGRNCVTLVKNLSTGGLL